jgi:4-amino-4-deoxy-L-arabinose transferase-like glycosyltransferase
MSSNADAICGPGANSHATVCVHLPAGGQLFRQQRYALLALLLTGGALFVADASRLALPSLDDCFYAEKAAEMARTGSFFRVTWDGRPAFQNPPLQIFLVSLSFRALGTNDLAARLPSIAMALCLLYLTYRIGKKTLGLGPAMVGTALLIVSPPFVEQARRCMMDLPLGLWVAVSMMVALEASTASQLHWLLALTLAAGVLTKSVLGFQSLLILLASAACLPTLRSSLLRAPAPAALAAGVLLGCSWYLYLLLQFGPAGLAQHLLGEVGSRTFARFDWVGALTYYPRVLTTGFEPVLLPALAGAIRIGRRMTRGDAGLKPILLWWAVIPPLLFSFSAARSERYLFPIFPALALLAGSWLYERFPRPSRALVFPATPLLGFAAALVLATHPRCIWPRNSQEIKDARAVFQSAPAGQATAYVGNEFWPIANPLLYYQGRPLAAQDSVVHAVEAARASSSHLLFLTAEQIRELKNIAPDAEALLQGTGWTLLRVGRGPESTQAADEPALGVRGGRRDSSVPIGKLTSTRPGHSQHARR